VLLVLGLTAVVPSPSDWVWLLGVLVTEGGHWALVACLPLFARELFIGVSSPAVRVEDHLFASVGGQELWLDLYRPVEDHPPLPWVVVVHSGSWQSGSLKDLSALNRYLAAHGCDYVFSGPCGQITPTRSNAFSRRCCDLTVRGESPVAVQRETVTTDGEDRVSTSTISS
jgi:hypothetical protein